ncbi:MAG: sodium:proton exchanger [Crocinitomicaceae bacterium]|nr:sodium:proton exchanger [Crocinitomicaceae bacterium]|tara:strand:+ start:20418 stop:21716 length:1299 start_codon:yes stop_codon:yes gene_type:complete
MGLDNPYILVIVLCSLLILSYLFNILAKKTNIPSVVLLISTGVIISYGLDYFHQPGENANWFPILKILGIVGLVMIVLEAALDLKLTKEKWPIIWKAFAVALFGLAATALIFTFLIQFFFVVDTQRAFLYAIPLSVISSAIVIPSVINCREDIKEFLIYESTFSDILGIMLFYFDIKAIEAPAGASIGVGILLNILLTLVIAVVLSYVLTVVFQKIASKTKLFLLISVLMLLYSVGKLLHISSLLIILFFGLLINNHELFFIKGLEKHVDSSKVKETLANFKVITLESSFFVRTFFFITFGMSIALSSLINVEVLLISLIMLGVMIVLRYLIFIGVAQKFIMPSLFVAPRGLITILLFFSIPQEHQIPHFDNGVLLYIILVSSGIMTLALMTREKEEKLPFFLKATSRMMKGDDRHKESIESLDKDEENTSD